MARWWVAGVISVLVRGADAACPPPDAARPTMTPGTHNLGLVVSGGVSEGSYQAGATYALLHHYLRHRAPGQLDLRVATGSSAGNINIVLASTYWLSARSLETARVMNNIFFDMWTNVGWDRLAPVRNRASAYGELFTPALGGLPPGGPDLSGEAKGFLAPVYNDQDGLVTRHALDQVVANAKNRFKGDWRTDACLELGVTLTSESLHELRLRTSIGAAAAGAPDGKSVSVQRFVVPLSVETPKAAPGSNASDQVQGELAFKGPSSSWAGEHPRVGATKQMPAAIDAKTLFDLVKAAKGFPVAFGPMHVPKDDKHPRFWDGGCSTTFRWAWRAS
jgi:hypothetical protein